MNNIYISADWHLGHKNILNFKNENGTFFRPRFDIDAMHDALLEKWNAIVKPSGRVYLLGDVAMNRRALTILPDFNGRKVLVKGNHDIFKLKDYLPYFDDIRACVVKDKFIMSHIPVHPDSKARFTGNIHGHLHANKIADPWYRCVSVEQTDFGPLSFEQLRDEYRKREADASN